MPITEKSGIEKSIERIEADVKSQLERLRLYKEMAEVFKGIDFPEGTNIWFNRYISGRIGAEFSPAYDEEADKNLQPLVHKLARKFRKTFVKHPNWDNSALDYSADLEVGEKKISVTIRGVVPKSCHVEITETPLTEEEIEKARQEALANVKTTRVEKKIVCK